MKKFFLIQLLLLLSSLQLLADDYYWVGGQGIWSDISHWAKTSGGKETHFVVPTAADDVHFDANSFTGPSQSVLVTFGGDVANVVCRNMDWSGSRYNPILLGKNNQNLRICGSLTLISAMSFSFAGVVNFETTSTGNTITSAGMAFNNDVVFQGSGGWILQDNLTTTNAIQLISGSLNTNGKAVKCWKFLSKNENIRSLNISNSSILLKENYYSQDYDWDVNGTGLTLSSKESLIIFYNIIKGMLHTGTPLHYFNIKFISDNHGDTDSKMGNSNFNRIYFGESASNAPSNMGLIEVHYADSIISFCAQNNVLSYDSVNYIRILGDIETSKDSYYKDNSYLVAKKIMIGGNAVMKPSQKTDSLWIKGNARFNNHGTIKSDSIFGDADFINTSYEIERLVVKGNCNFSAINNIRNCVIYGNGKFENSNTFDSLYLSPQKIYQLGGGQTTTINKVISLEGQCKGDIFLQSTITGLQGILRKTSGDVTGNYLTLRDIKGEGGPLFTAGNAIDLGNNSGWTINKSNSSSLFWVGGTGNWDDQDHWSFTSGGPGGACPPTAIDDAIFDTNSFSSINQVVTINIENPVCRNINWSGAKFNPEMTGPSKSTLRIFGSLNFIPAMIYSFSGVIDFEATTMGNTISSTGKTFNNDVIFQGTGEWTLKDDLITKLVLNFRRGNLITNGKTVQCKRFHSTESNPRNLNIANSLVKITDNVPGNDNNFFDIDGTSLTLKANESLVEIESGNDVYSVFHHVGTPANYYNVKFVYGSSSNIIAGGSSFNLINAGDSQGNAPHFMHLDAVHRADSIISYSNLLNSDGQVSSFAYDSVNYIRTVGSVTFNNANQISYARKVIIGRNSQIGKIIGLTLFGYMVMVQFMAIMRSDVIQFLAMAHSRGRIWMGKEVGLQTRKMILDVWSSWVQAILLVSIMWRTVY